MDCSRCKTAVIYMITQEEKIDVVRLVEKAAGFIHTAAIHLAGSDTASLIFQVEAEELRNALNDMLDKYSSTSGNNKEADSDDKD